MKTVEGGGINIFLRK